MSDPSINHQKLEYAGWQVGFTAEFLNLTPEESAIIEMKLDPFYQWYDAGELELTIDDCPYIKGTPEYKDWFQGYQVWLKSWLRQRY